MIRTYVKFLTWWQDDLWYIVDDNSIVAVNMLPWQKFESETLFHVCTRAQAASEIWWRQAYMEVITCFSPFSPHTHTLIRTVFKSLLSISDKPLCPYHACHTHRGRDTQRHGTLPVKMFGPFWSVWSKMALAEVGLSLSWWCPALVLLAPGYWSVFLNLIFFS